MKIFFLLKNWQLFLLSFVLPNLISSFNFFENKNQDFKMISMLIMIFSIFGWIWSVVNVLYRKLPTKETFNIWKFRIIFLMTISILIWILWKVENNLIKNNVLLLTLGVFTYLGFMIYLVLTTAKTIKSVELQKEVSIQDSFLDAILIWLFPIGIWIIQPRINALNK